MLDKIPKGWRFYTADGSIEGNVSVMLVRDEEGRKRWFRLDELCRLNVDLYKRGRGKDLYAALEGAIASAEHDNGFDNYSI